MLPYVIAYLALGAIISLAHPWIKVFQRLKIRQSFEGGNIPKNGDDFQRQISNSI